MLTTCVTSGERDSTGRRPLLPTQVDSHHVGRVLRAVGQFGHLIARAFH